MSSVEDIKSQVQAAPKPKALRRRRFRREPNFSIEGSRAGHLVIMRRDLDIITAIAKHRFLNTDQVCALFACDCPKVGKIGQRNGQATQIFTKSHRPHCSCTCGVEGGKRDHAEGCPALFKNEAHVRSRLLELYQAGYLDRPVAQLQLRVKDGVIGEGSVPLVYSVTSSGLNLVGSERRAKLGAQKLSWVRKANEGKRVFIEHTLAVANMSVGLDRALRRYPTLVRFSDEVLHAGLTDERKKLGRLWNLKVTYRSKRLGTVCDLAFAIGNTVVRRRWNFFAEVDLGHMPVERVSFNETSIMKKLIVYAKAFEDGLHKTEFGWGGFQVIILTTSQDRVRSCVEAAYSRFGSAVVGKIFLFGTLNAAENLFAYEFTTITGGPARLIRDV